MGSITTTTNRVTPWSEPQLNDRLNALVSTNDPGAYLPIVGPNSAAALRTYLDAATPPMPTIDHVDSMLAKLSMALPKAQVSKAEARERLEIYWRALKGISLPDLHHAFAKLIKTARFFPSAAEIMDIAAETARVRNSRRAIAQQLIWKHEREWRPPPEPLTDDQKTQLSTILDNAGENVIAR